MNIFVLGTIYATVGGLAVGVFLWGKPDGNSVFDKLWRLVCIHLPWGLKKVAEKCCGPRGPKALDATWNYICYTTNPIVQIFYLCVLVGGFAVFVMYGFPHVPNRLAGGWHKYSGFCVFTTCLYVWWNACKADAGTVTEKNVDELCDIYPYDNLIFGAASCSTCNLKKPARSKHCSLCDVCVARFDHHCIWLNNCVGVGNHKWFLGFLFVHLLLVIYGGSLGSLILWDLVVQKDLLNAVFVDPTTKVKHEASYMIVGQYMLATEGMVVFVTILCAIMGAVLFGFFIWHLNLVRLGTTTNELSKWHYVKWCIKQEEDGKEKVKNLKNIYNQGIVANFREVFFNLDLSNLDTRTDLDEQSAGSAQAKKESKAKKGSKDKAKKA